MSHLCGFVIALAVLLGAAAGAPTALAQGTVHRVLIGDTRDPSLGDKALEGLKAFSKLTQSIASNTKRKDNLVSIVGTDFSCANIRTRIAGIATNSDDVVIIFYAGHGFRDEDQQSPFPKIFCDHGATGGELFESLVETAGAIVRPRMIWAMADACNVTYEEAAGLPSAAPGETFRAGLNKLFTEPRGQVIMAGAQASEFSWYWASGGQFTIQLIKAVTSQIARGQNADWRQLVADAGRPFNLVYTGPNTGVSKAYDQKPEMRVALQLSSGAFNFP